SARIGVSAFFKCCVEPMRPVAPCRMMPIVRLAIWISIVCYFRCDVCDWVLDTMAGHISLPEGALAHFSIRLTLPGSLPGLTGPPSNHWSMFYWIPPATPGEPAAQG